MNAIEYQITSQQLDEQARWLLGSDHEELKQESIKTGHFVEMQNIQDNIHDIKKKTLRERICEEFEISTRILFERSRRRDIVNARQVYVYLVMTTNLVTKEVIPIEKIYYNGKNPQMEGRDRPCVVARHVGWDHATMYHCCRTTQNYYDTEKFFRNTIDMIRKELFEGKVVMPNVKIPASKETEENEVYLKKTA